MADTNRQHKNHEPRAFILSRIWRSIFARPIVPSDDRGRRRTILDFLVLHARPVQVPARAIRFSHTFGLGGSCLVFLLVLAASGILLMLAYEPSPERAYQSILDLEQHNLFGAMVRSIHHWSANLLVAVALLHLLRVFFTGGFHGPRQFNWVIGLALFGVIMAANFTGYLLPWDQLSYWAVTICTAMLSYVPLIGGWLQSVARGGNEIGPSTLIIFFTVHTTIAPATLVFLTALHFWRVRKARGVVMPRAFGEELEEQPATVLTLPHLLVREAALASALVALVMGLAAVLDAPLGAEANPGMSTNPAKAPWYFMGFQELQLHFDPLFAVLLIPLLALAALTLLPYLRTETKGQGVWFISPTGRKTGSIAALTALIATPLLVIFDEWVFDPTASMPGVAAAISCGLLPFAVIGGAVVVFVHLIAKRFSANREERIQALFILFAVALAVLTIAGVYFRGPGMKLGLWI